ncbi:hypothetical protein Plhal304r1_c035g0108811 [Plasmopara halstedii]
MEGVGFLIDSVKPEIQQAARSLFKVLNSNILSSAEIVQISTLVYLSRFGSQDAYNSAFVKIPRSFGWQYKRDEQHNESDSLCNSQQSDTLCCHRHHYNLSRYLLHAQCFTK